ncbi:hypothetical protein R8G64_13705 [Tenacibaculum maritimum]|uniref:hypothetical protein n=1 Tax=Tenacibaculum maritimum TaxID=107401 RepID=UPI0012E6A129|nr:hypothetical protein [Tenacibaculum maritimum]CAA0210262.1 Probable lipoprotein precursor [Tenacibaculum maritimum]
MRISKIIMVILMATTTNSCSSQNKIDLLAALQNKTFLEQLIPKEQRALFFYDKIDPASGTPVMVTTKETDRYTFGTYNIPPNPTKVRRINNQIGICLYKALNDNHENKIAGIWIHMKKIDDRLFEYLKELYGTPKETSPKPTVQETTAERRARLGLKNEGVVQKKTEKQRILHGSNDFLWQVNDMTIVYSDFYRANTAYIDDDGNKIADPKEEQYISASVYIIRNDAMDMTTPGRTSAQRLIATFK